MMMNPRRLIIPLMLSLQLWGLQAAATSVLPISLQRMAGTAAVIFHGRVTGNEVRQDPASGQIVTVTEFEVLEAVKGNPGKTYRIKQIGGQLPGSIRRLVIHGVPVFSVDEEYVVFLPNASSLGFASPIGLSQGKFNVVRQNGKEMVTRGRAPAAVLNTQQPALPEVPSALETVPAGTDLGEFLQTVRGMAGE
ncbi:MAG: hypothetical protein WBO16_11460 [Gammaproteobacteria bacterium]|jgi:hypothetical protein